MARCAWHRGEVRGVLMGEAFIVSAARTAGGRRGGRLAGVHPVDLGAAVVDALLDRAGADPILVEDVIFGCVSQIGEQSTNIARNVVLASELPQMVPGVTIDRQCGSSQQALHFAAHAVMAGAMDVVIAGGVESMSRVPMGSPVAVAAANGLGQYKSPGVEARYPKSNSVNSPAPRWSLRNTIWDATFWINSRSTATAKRQTPSTQGS